MPRLAIDSENRVPWKTKLPQPSLLERRPPEMIEKARGGQGARFTPPGTLALTSQRVGQCAAVRGVCQPSLQVLDPMHARHLEARKAAVAAVAAEYRAYRAWPWHWTAFQSSASSPRPSRAPASCPSAPDTASRRATAQPSGHSRRLQAACTPSAAARGRSQPGHWVETRGADNRVAGQCRRGRAHAGTAHVATEPNSPSAPAWAFGALTLAEKVQADVRCATLINNGNLGL